MAGKIVATTVTILILAAAPIWSATCRDIDSEELTENDHVARISREIPADLYFGAGSPNQTYMLEATVCDPSGEPLRRPLDITVLRYELTSPQQTPLPIAELESEIGSFKVIERRTLETSREGKFSAYGMSSGGRLALWANDIPEGMEHLILDMHWYPGPQLAETWSGR